MKQFHSAGNSWALRSRSEERAPASRASTPKVGWRMLPSETDRVGRPLARGKPNYTRWSVLLQSIASGLWRRLPISLHSRVWLKYVAHRGASAISLRLLRFLAARGAPIGSPADDHAQGDSTPRSLRGRSEELSLAFNRRDPTFGAYTTAPLSCFMHFLWQSRPDLQRGFDITDAQGRLAFTYWYAVEGKREYDLGAAAFPDYVLKPAQNAREAAPKSNVRRPAQVHGNDDGPGANLLGYATGQFGMGQQVRAVAAACSAASIPFVVCNIEDCGHGGGDDSVSEWIATKNRYGCNLININADILPALYFRLRHEFFAHKTNIGYWAWELPRAPEAFDLAFSMVDEVWAVSRFVQQSLSDRSPVPVVHMPLPVIIPSSAADYRKVHFDLPEDCFAFLFVFDAASHLKRKNPAAAVRAFLTAFPDKRSRVRLILKTMNVREDDEDWKDLVHAASGDERISILKTRTSRETLLGLINACDAFVSLHRSEGFGLCVAESMWLGKPVIATNYSGTVDFAHKDTACVVGYSNCPVKPGDYPFSDKQCWAEPDVEEASVYMRRLVEDNAFRSRIAKAGQAEVQKNLAPSTIGRRYARRLAQLGVSIGGGMQ